MTADTGRTPDTGTDIPRWQAWAQAALPYAKQAICGAAMLVVAVVMGRVSYIHIYDLSIALHQPPPVAHLMPFGVDGMVVVGSMLLLEGQRMGWWGIGVGGAISLIANVASGWAYGVADAAWAGVPAVSFALSTFLFERWLKARTKRPAAATATRRAPRPAKAPKTQPAAEQQDTPPPPAGSRADQAVLLRGQGLLQEDIAERLGVTVRTIRRDLAKVNGSA